MCKFVKSDEVYAKIKKMLLREERTLKDFYGNNLKFYDTRLLDSAII